MKKSPPKYPLKLLRWFCRDDFIEEIEGDLVEIFEQKCQENHRKAVWGFFWQVLLHFRPAFIRPINLPHFLIRKGMLKHSFLISYRGFLRNKTSFLINIIGLSTGLACALLIYLWIHDENRVDKFHENDDRLYQVMTNFPVSNEILTWDFGPGLMAEGLLAEIPDVEAATQNNSVYQKPSGLISFEEKHLNIDGLFARKNYLEVFSYGLIHGNKQQVLKDKNQIVISEKLALQLFNSAEKAIGKTVQWKTRFFDQSFQISGVLDEIPPYSTKQFDALVNYELLIDADQYAGKWNGGYAETFVVLKEGTNISEFNQKIEKYIAGKATDWEVSSQFAVKYSDKYLHGTYEEGIQTGGRISYIQLFSLIGLFILIIACINFMNISTAQASKKMKEIGVKKAIGANQGALIFQFLNESILIAFFSFLIAVGIVFLTLPTFNSITNKALSFDWDFHVILIAFGIALLTGFLAGSYPALYLSRIKPLLALKGKSRSLKNEIWIRRGLVVFQFAITVIFIVGVIVINQQLHFTQVKNLGYNRSNVLAFERPPFTEDSQIFLSKIKEIPGVINSASIVSSFLSGEDSQDGYSWSAQESEKDFLFRAPMVGYDAIETLDIEVIQGRSFSRELNDDLTKILINETALKMMNLENPIGAIVEKNQAANREIIGVVKDFHYGSIHQKIEPLVFRLRTFGLEFIVKMQDETEMATIEAIEKIFNEHHPNHPFDYRFLDEEYQQLYEAEKRVAVLSKYFSGLAIIISCLGLFGLVSFSTERRIKEIGIRKVLGANSWQIVRLFSREFSMMILGGVFIAIPLSFYMAQKWLENFAYKIELEWWIFALATILTFSLAWIIVGFQTTKASYVNPAYLLRDD